MVPWALWPWAFCMGPLAHPWARPGLLGRTETALRENCAASKLRCEETAVRANGSAGARSVEEYNPNTLTRMPPTQLTLSGGIRSATERSRRPFLASTRCRSLGPKGTPGTPKEPTWPQGDPRAPSAPLGGGGEGGWRGFRHSALRAFLHGLTFQP